MDVSALAVLLDEHRYGECRDVASRLLRTTDLSAAEKAHISLALSYSLSALQCGQEALSPGELAVYFSREAGDYDLLGRALCHLADLYHEVGLNKRAVICLEEYFQQFGLYRRAKALEGRVLGRLALCHQVMGRGEKALAYYKRALHWHLADGASAQAVEEWRGQLLWHLLRLGQLDEARDHLAESQAYLRAAPNDLEARAAYLNNAAYRYFLTSAYGAAIETAVQVMQVRNVSALRKAQACLTLHATARAMGMTREAMGLGTLARIQANVAKRPDLEHEAIQSMLHMQQAERLPLMEELLRSLERFAAAARG